MKVMHLLVGPLATNCYFLQSTEGDSGIIVDPGGDSEVITKAVRTSGIDDLRILNTHSHGDHIAANSDLVATFGCPILIGRDDAQGLEDPSVNLSIFLGISIVSPAASTLLEDGDIIKLGNDEIHVLSTLGHSVGSISLYVPSDGLLFCGDLLFMEGVGRTDLPGGAFDVLMESICEKVFSLPDETVVYPGHGPATTVGHERLHNPFLGQNAQVK